MTAVPAIGVRQLTKTFRVARRHVGAVGSLRGLFAPRQEVVRAVDNLSLSIGAGERVAFIGPNGAGKSTTLKVLTGILYPERGDVRVLGCIPWRDRSELAFKIGTVFGQRSQLWHHLPPRDTFALLADVYEIDSREHRRRLDALVETFAIGPFLDTPVRQLSLGQRMRADIAASLLHAPQVLFLDEPTIGLDVTAKAAIRALLCDEVQNREMTMVLTSHDTGDIERVCDRAIVIHQGRLLWDGSIAELRRTYVTSKRLTLWSGCATVAIALPGVRLLTARPYYLELELEPGTTPVGAVVDAAVRQGPLHDLAIEDSPLDEVIRELYRNADRGAPCQLP